MKKVLSNLDFFLPFCQHGPSLANARGQIYANIDQFPGEDGAGLFNVLAFRGVFFGSPFAQSDRYRWFNTLSDWEKFRAEGLHIAKMHGKDGEEEKYYVKRSCYGQSQVDRSTKLLEIYWGKRHLWSTTFNKPTKPSITEVHKWLQSSFRNIGSLSALLICGDLVEADVLAFTSLDLALQQELKEEEKKVMNYNVVMLEYALCKIKRLTTRGIPMDNVLKKFSYIVVSNRVKKKKKKKKNRKEFLSHIPCINILKKERYL